MCSQSLKGLTWGNLKTTTFAIWRKYLIFLDSGGPKAQPAWAAARAPCWPVWVCAVDFF
jgi:hypothetical protein